MLFGFCQLKTTVFALLLASCLGHQLLRTCQWDYCYERSIERRDIEGDNLRKLYGDEGRRADTASETGNLNNISRGLRENPPDQFDSESNREIRRELKTLSENHRELIINEPIRREHYRNLIELDNRRITVDEDDFYRRVDETPEIQHSAKLLLERRQETNKKQHENRLITPINRLNERENHQNRDELQDENQEPHRINDRLSMRQNEVFQHSEESETEREINDLDRHSPRSSDRISEREQKLLQRREENQVERVNRESRRSDESTSERDPEPIHRRHKNNEQRNTREDIIRNGHETNRYDTQRETENPKSRRFNEKISERAPEIRFENLRRERENVGNMDKSRRLSLTEDDLWDRYDSRLDERERNNHRSIEQLSEKPQESIQRREGSVQERDNRLEEVKRSSSRHNLREHFTEQRENLRRLNKRESLDENHRSIEQLFERNQEALQRREMNRRERTDNREFERSNSRLSAQRCLTEHKNEWSNEHLTEQRENLRRLNKPEPLDENHHSREQERRQEVMQRIEINRRERADNRKFQRSNSRLSAQREASRRLNEHENRRYNKHLSNVEDRNERRHDFNSFDENRESRKSSQRIIETEERNVQRRIANDMERERSSERNVQDHENPRVTTKQFDNQEQRYDINNRRTEREFIQRRGEDTRKRENKSRQPAITQQEQRLEVFNRRGEQRSVKPEFSRRRQHRYDNSPERENVLNRNRNFQRSSELLAESDEESLENRSKNYREHVDRIRSSRRSEQRNNDRQADENQNSRQINERHIENGLLNRNLSSRRSSLSINERESMEKLNVGNREYEKPREELRELDERVDQREINRASDRSVGEIQRSRLRIFENVENIRERDNHNLNERKLQHETNRRLETCRSNERQDRIESTRNNHQMVLRKGEATKLQQRRDENKREQREERENQRSDTLSNRNVENRRDLQFIVDEHKETPTDSLKNSNIAYIQGVLLAIVVMKTLNGKNNIKCQVSQKFQEAIAMMGF